MNVIDKIHRECDADVRLTELSSERKLRQNKLWDDYERKIIEEPERNSNAPLMMGGSGCGRCREWFK